MDLQNASSGMPDYSLGTLGLKMRPFPLVHLLLHDEENLHFLFFFFAIFLQHSLPLFGLLLIHPDD